MKTLTCHLQNYLSVRRSLGFDLVFTERVLLKFTAFANAQDIDYITVRLFLDWKSSYGAANNNTWSTRLGMVRAFATWLQGFDPRTEIPPSGLVAGKPKRSRPHIYTDEQVTAIVTEATHLRSPYGLRGVMCSTLFGLIAVTGLRISEALKLDDRDVDLNEAVITVRCSKNGKTRLLPISATTVNRLDDYRTERERLLGRSSTALFLLENGVRPTDCCARYNFAQVCQRIELRDHQSLYRHGRGPRIHDLRHTFAVRTIIDWYRSGRNADREMFKLSTYMGHIKPEYTYWYIEAVPELLQLASERVLRSIAGGGQS